MALFLSAATAACSSSSPVTNGGSGGSASGGAGGGAPSCDGFQRAVTSYTDADKTLDHLPAVIDGAIPGGAGADSFTISLSEATDMKVHMTLPYNGGLLTLDGMQVGPHYDPSSDYGVYDIDQQIFGPGDHTLRVDSGTLVDVTYQVTIDAWDAAARRCDPAFVDPSAGAADATHTPECDAYFARYNSNEGCMGLTVTDSDANRARLCVAPGAACVRAVRVVLACLAQKGSCPPNATSLEDLVLVSPDCAPRAADCE